VYILLLLLLTMVVVVLVLVLVLAAMRGLLKQIIKKDDKNIRMVVVHKLIAHALELNLLTGIADTS